MATQEVGPLQHNVPIADERGNPTPQFLRKWQTLLIQLDDLNRRITELEGTP